MNDEIWLKLAKRLNAVLAEPGTNGALITHAPTRSRRRATSCPW